MRSGQHNHLHLFGSTKPKLIASVLLTLVLAACGGGPAPAPTSSAGDPNLPVNTVVPTAVASVSEVLPPGVLILTQLGRAVAQFPNQQIITLSDERFQAQGSPDTRYGVRFNLKTDRYDLEIVDYTTPAAVTKPIPEGAGFTGPGITWRADSQGFAFFDFPNPALPRSTPRTILYYDVASGQTKRLLPEPTETGKIAAPVAFSPDAKYLLYAVGDASAEGVGGPGSQAFIFELAADKSNAMPTDALLGFNQWLRDSSGYLTLRFDEKGSTLWLYRLNALNAPTQITPQGSSDQYVTLSPDGKWIAVTASADPRQPANIYRVSIESGSRTQISQFAAVDQTITALVWGNDGIYYSFVGADGQETTWRVDLDGKNAVQIARGTLYRIVGVN
jgi:WD40 repeat protein